MEVWQCKTMLTNSLLTKTDPVAFNSNALLLPQSRRRWWRTCDHLSRRQAQRADHGRLFMTCPETRIGLTRLGFLSG